MRSFCVNVLCAVAASLLAAGVCAEERDQVARSRLDHLFSNLHQRDLFDGAVVVGKGRKVIWEKGFGWANETKRTLFTPATPTDGASLAKTFTAALVLHLAGEGKLKLDGPVRDYLPELPYPEITLRHLLSHSSGLPAYYDYFEKFVPAGQVRTTERLLAVIAERKPSLHFRPGTAFEYSSFAYDLAALATARATRKSYAALLRTRLFEPLGITSAFVRPARLSDFPGVRTLAYRHIGEERQLNDVFDFEGFHGGSNIYISAHDLHLWNAAFLTPSMVGKVSGGESLEFAHIGAVRSGLTLGSWYRSETGNDYWYAGHLQGFHGEVFREMDSGWSIVYVSNNTLAPWLQPAIVRATRRILAGNAVSALQPPAVAGIKKEARASLTGIWIFPDRSALQIQSAGDKLSVRKEGVVYEMVSVNETAFYVPGLHFMISFAKERDGSIGRIYVSTNLGESWGIRRNSPG